MRKLNLADAAFLINESRRTPMHVAALNLFTLPAGVDETEYLHEIADALRYDGTLRFPFGQILKTGALGPYGNVHLINDHSIDMDYHIRHSALPRPGRYRELFALVSRLHSQLLDRSRPLWELHLIEGLPNRQFATYFKIHHCVMDGVGAMHFSSSMLTDKANEKISQSPFSIEAYDDYKKKLAASAPPKPKAENNLSLAELIGQQIESGANVAKALGKNLATWSGENNGLSTPWRDMPKTNFSHEITGARRFVAQSWSLQRVKNMGKAYGGTLNDAVLAMCAGALRHYLISQNDLPEQSMKSMVPVSLRAAGDVDAANAVSFLTVDLATNISDPVDRINAIKNSTAAGKAQLQELTKPEISLYTNLVQAPLLLTTLTGMASKLPAFSTVISNVPGPQTQMYWHGAKLEGIYPASIPFEGFSVNFTLVSNNGMLDFGITACRNGTPQLQRLIDYLEDSLAELEEAAGIAPPSKAATKKPAPKTKAASKTKTKVKAKVKAKAASKSKPKAKPAAKAKPAKAKAKTKATPVKTKSKASVRKKPAKKKGPPKKVASK